MKRAVDLMDASPRTVTADLSVKALGQLLLDERLDGVCVVEGERLVGVVTSMDLIFQEQPVHLPSFFVFLDALIPLENPLKARHEMEKLAGACVGDIMSSEVISVGPQASLEEVASQMVRHHLSVVPVVEGGRLLGVVTKPAMLRAAFSP